MTARTTTERRLRFEQLVERAEAKVAADPAGYRLRVGLLALLGYAVLFGLAAGLVLLIGGAAWGAVASTAFLVLLLKNKLIIPLLVMLWVLARSLWVRIDAPDGRRLTRREFPELFDEIDALRKRLAVPAIHRVVLTEEFNAAMSQTPRLGVLGWQRNTLVLGLQLLMTLSPGQARAVLAHEFGHLSGNHSRFNGWIYRLRVTWYRAMEAFDASGGWGTGLVRRFFDWYAPTFDAYSFALARANEFEADAMSAEVTSRAAAAQALVCSHVVGDVIGERYWDPLIARADTEAEPAAAPFTGLDAFLRALALDRDEWLARIRRAIDRRTDRADTHPSLNDRLGALDGPAVLPKPVLHSAAQAWLGKGYRGILAESDRAWLQRNGEAWRARHAEAREARARIDALLARPRESLSLDERWNLAAWTERFRPDANPLPLYLELNAAHPDCRDAQLAIGRLLLARDDARGLRHLERAVERFPLVLPACETAYAWLRRSGNEAAAERWRERAEAHLDLEARARQERSGLDVKDRFVACRLPDDALGALADAIRAAGKFRRAWICEKSLTVLPDDPLYVVVFEARGLMPDEEKLAALLLESVDWPGATFVLMKGGSAARVAKRAMAASKQLF
ncbi:MAG: M48 family metalloprotease [Pseudomonadota bacterium]